MKNPESNSKIHQVLSVYKSLHPDFNFPENFPEENKMGILQNSRGRKIVFAKVNGEYQTFYEDAEEEKMDIPSWNKLIGCGG